MRFKALWGEMKGVLMKYESCVRGFMVVALMAVIQFNSNSQGTAGIMKKPVSYELKEISGRHVYCVHPEGMPPANGWRVIILLHGRGQSGGAWFGKGPLSMGEQKTFPQDALRANYAILAPDSGKNPISGARQWDCMHRVVERSEDLLFFRDLLNWVKKMTGQGWMQDRSMWRGFPAGDLWRADSLTSSPLGFGRFVLYPQGMPIR